VLTHTQTKPARSLFLALRAERRGGASVLQPYLA
jgi:hypothetical protein